MYTKTRKRFKFISLLVILKAFLIVNSAFSLPHFALTSGEKCINCHATTQGGGIRNARGRIFNREAALLKPESVQKLYKRMDENSSLFNDRLKLGTDLRFQTARSHKSEDSKRRFFPMQAALNSTCEITNNIFLEASYNFGPKKFFGQQKWTASVIVQPQYSLTQLRIGYFQPSIGIRYDDHTMLIRQVGGAYGSTLIAPNYAEYGAEFTYNKIQWLSLTAGIFDPGSISENFVTNKSGSIVSLIDDISNPSYLGRFEIRKNVLEQTMAVNAGSSLFINGDFYLLNVFSGIGLTKNLSALAEYAHSDKNSVQVTDNFSIDVSYRIFQAFVPYIRYERAVTDASYSGFNFETYTNQAVLGTQIFVHSFVELRPEFRYVDTEMYRSTRYAVQLHLFL